MLAAMSIYSLVSYAFGYKFDGNKSKAVLVTFICPESNITLLPTGAFKFIGIA